MVTTLTGAATRKIAAHIIYNYMKLETTLPSTLPDCGVFLVEVGFGGLLEICEPTAPHVF